MSRRRWMPDQVRHDGQGGPECSSFRCTLMTDAAVIILALVTLQRLAELVIARRNTARLLADGAREVAPGHYPLIVAVHAGWLAALWWLAPGKDVAWPLIGLFL